MNRQQRRALKRRRESEERIDKLMREAKCNPKEIEVELYYTAFGLALEEVYGYKTERIRKVWKRADEYIGMMVDNDMTLDDMKRLLRERANIECSFN